MRKWKQKPPIGTILDRTNPLLNGLVWFAPFLEGGGNRLSDMIGGVDLLATNAATWSPGNSPQMGAGLSLSTNGYHAQTTLPTNLYLQAPFTFVIGLRMTGSQTGTTPFLGLLLNNSSAAEFGNVIRGSLATGVTLLSSTASASNTASLFTLNANTDYILTAVFNPTSYKAYLYNCSTGIFQTASGNWVNSPLSAVYTSTSLVGFGAMSGYTSNPGNTTYFGAIYNRALSFPEVQSWINPWQLFKRKPDTSFIYPVFNDTVTFHGNAKFSVDGQIVGPIHSFGSFPCDGGFSPKASYKVAGVTQPALEANFSVSASSKKGPFVTKANPYISKNGLIATFFEQYALNNFINVTAITGMPLFYLNGSPNPLSGIQGPFWMNTSHNCPWAFYQYPSGFAITDTLTMTTASGWATAAGSGIPAQTNVNVPNYMGQLEPSIGGYGGVPVPGFNQPTSEWTMQLGYNVSWGGSARYYSLYFPFANALKRGSLPNNIVSATDTGTPTVISHTMTLAPVETDQANSVDGRGIPTITGVYRFVADEGNPQHPMVITANTQAFSTLTGPIITGSGIGKTWEWELAYTSDYPNSYFNPISFNIAGTGAGGYGNYSLTNECLLMPNNSIRPTNNFGVDNNFITSITTASNKTPFSLRWMDTLFSTGYSEVVDVEDLMDPDDWIWGGNQNGIFNVFEINAFTPSSSPYIYFAQKFPNSVTPGGGPPGAPYALPTNPGFFNFTGPNTTWYMGEIFYDNSVYQVKSGHNVRFGVGNSVTGIPTTNGDGSPTTVSLSNATLPCVFASSPSSFIFSTPYNVFINTSGQPGRINNVLGTNAVTGITANFYFQDQGSVGHGPSAYATAQIPNTNYWANFSAIGTDAMVATGINAVLANYPPGNKIIVECGNELWNDGNNSYFYMYGVGTMSGYVANSFLSQTVAIVHRTAEMHDICYNAANSLGRGNEIVRSFGGFMVIPSFTTQIVGIINDWNANNPSSVIQMDQFHVATYENCPMDSTIVKACASIYNNYNNSIASGSPYPFTRGQYIDICRHFTKYYTNENGPNGEFLGHVKALQKYIPVNNQPSGFVPTLVTYEGGLQQLIPAGVSVPDDLTVDNGLMHDIFYDPEMVNWELACYQTWQQGGISLANMYALCMIRAGAGTSTDAWAHYIWDGQEAGDGSTNLFYQNTQRSQDFVNKSTRGHAWKIWADVTNPAFENPSIINVNFTSDGNFSVNNGMISRQHVSVNIGGDIQLGLNQYLSSHVSFTNNLDFSTIVNNVQVQPNINFTGDANFSTVGCHLITSNVHFSNNEDLFVLGNSQNQTVYLTSYIDFINDSNLQVSAGSLHNVSVASNCDGSLAVAGYNLDTNVPVYVVYFTLRSQNTKRQ